MSKIKISVVSYLNSKVFIKGLIPKSKNIFDISLDIPSVCAHKLITNEADIGLIPVAVIPEVPNAEIISNYCISATNSVNSVFLFSNSDVHKIHTVYLDTHSRTSNLLCKVLAKEYWNIEPQYLKRTTDIIELKEGEAFVLIGDRTFESIGKYSTQLDLSEEWFKLTQLPFVFAVWIANKKISSSDLQIFNDFLRNGFNFLDEVIEENKLSYFNIDDYLKNKIEYELDDTKRKAIQLFLDKSKDLRT